MEHFEIEVGEKCRNSSVEQEMRALARPTDNMPDTRQVDGVTRSKNIQKRGRVVGGVRTLEALHQYKLKTMGV